MPRSVKSKSVFLVSKQTESGIEHLGALTTFRAAHGWVLFKGGISTPNLIERAALAELRKSGISRIYNAVKFESIESAMWSPDAELYWIAEIPIIRNS
jgi:hypothetical protein